SYKQIIFVVHWTYKCVDMQTSTVCSSYSMRARYFLHLIDTAITLSMFQVNHTIHFATFHKESPSINWLGLQHHIHYLRSNNKQGCNAPTFLSYETQSIFSPLPKPLSRLLPFEFQQELNWKSSCSLQWGINRFSDVACFY